MTSIVFLLTKQVEIHDEMLTTCMDRLKAAYDTIGALMHGGGGGGSSAERTLAAGRMIRVLTVLREYVAECDDAHGEERAILPLGRYGSGFVFGPVLNCLVSHEWLGEWGHP